MLVQDPERLAYVCSKPDKRQHLPMCQITPFVTSEPAGLDAGLVW